MTLARDVTNEGSATFRGRFDVSNGHKWPADGSTGRVSPVRIDWHLFPAGLRLLIVGKGGKSAQVQPSTRPVA